MTDTDNFVLPQHEWRGLRELLAEIPAVVEDLSVTTTRQDQLGSGPRVRNGDGVQPMPFNEAASDAGDLLRGELAKWVRRTATTCHLDPPAGADTLTLARWLSRYIVDLAKVADSDIAPARIRQRIRDCRRVCDLPAPADHVRSLDVNPESEAHAHNLELNARSCVEVIRTLGDKYPGVTQRKINYLTETGQVRPLRKVRAGKETLNIYRLGDILTATRVEETESEIA